MKYTIREATPRDDERFNELHTKGAEKFGFLWLNCNEAALRVSRALDVKIEHRVIRTLMTCIIYAVLNNSVTDYESRIKDQAAEIARLKERAVIERDLWRREVHNLRRALNNIEKYCDTLDRAKSLAGASLKENDSDCHARLTALDEFDANTAKHQAQ